LVPVERHGNAKQAELPERHSKDRPHKHPRRGPPDRSTGPRPRHPRGR
jgi:hypothetical protein